MHSLFFFRGRQAFADRRVTSAAGRVGAYPAIRTDLQSKQVRRSVKDPVLSKLFDENKIIFDELVESLKRLGKHNENTEAAIHRLFARPVVWADADGKRPIYAFKDEMVDREKKVKTTGS